MIPSHRLMVNAPGHCRPHWQIRESLDEQQRERRMGWTSRWCRERTKTEKRVKLMFPPGDGIPAKG